MTKKGLAPTKDRLRRRLKRVGLAAPEDLVEPLARYIALLKHWNERMNLTALDDRDAGLDRLIIEPLVAVGRLPRRRGRMLDVGSGGGSPAIPMKLAAPGLRLLMVEAKVRKAAFLREVCRQLHIEGASVETGRYESLLTRVDLHEAHDVLTLRAVRLESRVLRGLQAFLKPGGQMLLFRGGGGSDIPEDMRPPLNWVATYPLVEALRSRLVVVEKRAVGRGE